MALGISNIIIGAGLLAGAGLAHAGASLMTALVVAGAGAVGIGVYQMWRQRYVYE